MDGEVLEVRFHRKIHDVQWPQSKVNLQRKQVVSIVVKIR